MATTDPAKAWIGYPAWVHLGKGPKKQTVFVVLNYKNRDEVCVSAVFSDRQDAECYAHENRLMCGIVEQEVQTRFEPRC